MSPQEFVDSLREIVVHASVTDTMRVVAAPPGRKPAAQVADLNAWFKRLDQSDRDRIEELLAMVAHQAVFGFLAILDGARQIEETVGPKGFFELRFVKNGKENFLSGPRGQVLHELL